MSQTKETSVVTTRQAQMGAMDVQTALLPFVIPWQGLDPAFTVLSLDPETPGDPTQDTGPQASEPQNTGAPHSGASGWAGLLAGLGIVLEHHSTGALPQGATVLTAFDLLDQKPPDTLGAWAAQAATALRPGGLLMMGGTYRHDAATQAQIRGLQDAGFARSRLILQTPGPGDSPLATALQITGQRYAIVAQTPAQGKAFDVFSPAFLATPEDPRSARITQAEAALHAHLTRALGVAHDRISHLDGRITHLDQRITHLDAHMTAEIAAANATLRAQATQAEQTTRHQAAEIAGLHAAIQRLERATRRRGLRKLAYQIKKKLRARRSPPSDKENG